MKNRAMTLQAITANRLGDGLAVFLAEDGSWSTEFLDARVIAAEDGGELEAAGEAAVAANRIVAPYLIDVERAGGRLQPVKFRERLRVDGPSRETLARETRPDTEDSANGGNGSTRAA